MFQVGQLAVYPAHGVGRIESVQEREVSGTPAQFYIMRLLDFDMIIMIPTNNARNIGLRDVIDNQAVDQVYQILRSAPPVRTTRPGTAATGTTWTKSRPAPPSRWRKFAGPHPPQDRKGSLLRGAQDAGYRQESINQRAFPGA